jgi:hypothetical protein
MPKNDPVLLEQALDQRKAEIAPDTTDSDFFELFVAEELLKDHALSYDELASGLVGGGNDGGIDGFWLFANGGLVQEDSDLSNLRRNVELELVIMQAKRSRGFGEDPINRLIAVTENLLDLSKDPSSYKARYSAELLASVDIFRNAYRELSGSFPSLGIRFVYASLGDDIHANTRAKSQDLLTKVPALFSSADPLFDFMGASDLLALARRQPKRSFTLSLAESPISATGAVAYICLVKLTDFKDFISDETNALRGDLFESNVRDYQGKTEVNREIRDSLANGGPEDFWWLNNGITVLAGQATQSGKALTLEDPQIVNGLQTSRQVFEHFAGGKSSNDSRLVLVRVIVPDVEESRDRIIKATNSQTYIPPASLKATDKIQRDIEEYLRAHGVYYDRRKNYYKNDGKPIADIVGIAKMAQAMMAIILARPDTARARPSSLIKSESDYARLFSTDHPIEVYLTCIHIVRSVETHLKSMDSLEAKDRNNLRFYIALEIARDITGDGIPSLSKLKDAATRVITGDDLKSCTELVLAEYTRLGGTDQVAKGTELKAALDALRGKTG